MIYTITSDINKNRSSFTTIDSKLNSIELLNSPDNDTIINLFTYLHSINSSNSIQKLINDEQHPFEYTDSFSVVSELVSSKLLQLEIPDSIHLLHNLTRIELIKCQLYGPLTESICSLPSLTYLNLSFNHLTGNIPTQIGDLSDLLYLNLSNNSFAGDFPSSINKLTKLSHLLLNNNCLDGDIPDCFHNLNKLKVFNIEHNKFSFRLPDSLLNLQNIVLNTRAHFNRHKDTPERLYKSKSTFMKSDSDNVDDEHTTESEESVTKVNENLNTQNTKRRAIRMEQNDGDWFHQFDNFNIDTNIALDDIITNKNNKTSYNLNYEDVLGISRDVNTITSNSFSQSDSNAESNNLMFSEVKSSANNNTEPHFEPDPEFSIRHRTDSMKVQVHRDFPKYKSYLSFSTAADQITTSKPVHGMNSCAHNLNLYIGLKHTTLVCTHCHKNHLLFNLHNLTNQIFDLLRYNCDGSQYQTSIPDMIPFKVRQKASYLYDYQCELCGMVTDYKALSKHYHFHMRQFMRDGIRRILEPSTDYKKVDSHGDSDRIATASFGKQDDGILGISDTVPLMRLSTYDASSPPKLQPARMLSARMEYLDQQDNGTVEVSDTVPLMRLSTYDASSPPKLRPDRLLSARMEYLDQQDNGNVEISDTTPLNRLSTYEANSPPKLQPARLLSAHMEYIEHNDGLNTQVEGSLGLGLGALPKHSVNMGGPAFSTHQMLPMAGNPSQNLPRSNTIELINQSLFGHDLNQGNMPLLDSTQDHIPSATVAKQSPKIKRLNTIERVNQSLFGSTIPESILESEASDVPKHTTRNDEYPPRFKPLKKNLYSLDPNHNAPMVFNTNEMGWSANHSQHPIPPRPLPTPPSQYRELLQETPTLNTLEKIQQKVYNRHKSSGSSELSDQWNFEGFQLNKHTDWESVNGSNSIVSSISSLEKIYEYAGMENPSQTSIPPRPSRMSNSMLPFDGSIPDTQNAIHEKGMKHISDSVNTHSSWLNVPPFNRVDDSQFNSLPQPKTQVNDQISTLNRIASGLKKSKSSGMLNVPESQPITHNIDQETLPTLSRRSVSPNAATYLHQNRSSNISPSPQIGGIQFVPDTRDFAEGMYIKSPNSNSKIDQPTFGQTRSVSPSYIQFGMPKANRRGSKYAESLLEDSLGKPLSPNQTNQQSLPHNPTLNPTVNRNDDITIEMLHKELNSTEQIDSDILLNRYRNLILQLGKQLQERQ